VVERLIIRLASKASQKIHWLIWSDSEEEIIASGELENAQQLQLLTEKAQQRTVICLLPGVDVTIREVAVKGSLNRQMQQALPYLLEDELAVDVAMLHFSVIAKQAEQVDVAICDKHKMAMWLNWLENAQISCRQFIPEGLALPVKDKWQAVQLDKQWLVRESSNLAWSCEQEMLDFIIAGKSNDDFTPQIETYSSAADNRVGEWIELPPILAMEILAKGTANNKINLLTGEFKLKKERNGLLDKWRMPGILAIVLLFFMMLNLYLQHLQAEKEIRLVKQHVETVYQQAFPMQGKLKYPRIKKKVKSMLTGLEGNVDSGFLLMLNELLPAFVQNPKFTPDSIKFDSNKQEMQISATADNFQSFEKFNALLPKHFNVQQGALNSNKEGVSGLLTIRMK
jgi:general secretion pathway protein L